jgi:hypothetical protein
MTSQWKYGAAGDKLLTQNGAEPESSKRESRMKRLILAAGGLLLATANTPPASVAPGGELDSVVAAEAPKGDHHPVAKPAKAKPPRIAVAEEPTGAYPRCSSTVRDRCVQGRSGYARASRGKAHHERRMQLAMRAGERG